MGSRGRHVLLRRRQARLQRKRWSRNAPGLFGIQGDSGLLWTSIAAEHLKAAWDCLLYGEGSVLIPLASAGTPTHTRSPTDRSEDSVRCLHEADPGSSTDTEAAAAPEGGGTNVQP